MFGRGLYLCPSIPSFLSPRSRAPVPLGRIRWLSTDLSRFSPTIISARRLHAMAQPVTLTTPSGKKITVPTGLFINNQFVPSVDSSETIQCVYPSLLRARTPELANGRAEPDTQVH